jgi:hypothetical protein
VLLAALLPSSSQSRAVNLGQSDHVYARKTFYSGEAVLYDVAPLITLLDLNQVSLDAFLVLAWSNGLKTAKLPHWKSPSVDIRLIPIDLGVDLR